MSAFPVTFILCWLQGLFLPIHIAFFLDLVPVRNPFDDKVLVSAMVAECIPMVSVLLLTSPIDGIPWFQWVVYSHLIIHLIQTASGVFWGAPNLHLPPGGNAPTVFNYSMKIIAKLITAFDAMMHIIIGYRLYTISHVYEVIFGLAFWISVFMTVDHQVFLCDTPKCKLHKNWLKERDAVWAPSYPPTWRSPSAPISKAD